MKRIEKCQVEKHTIRITQKQENINETEVEARNPKVRLQVIKEKNLNPKRSKKLKNKN